MALLMIFVALCGLMPLCFGEFISVADVTCDGAVYNKTSHHHGSKEKVEPPVLRCAINHNLTYEVKFTWSPVGRKFIEEDTKYEVVDQKNPPSSTLKFSRVGTRAAGMWTCTITGSEGQSISMDVALNSYPQIRSLPRSVNLVEGNTLEIKCEAWGYPLPTVSWLRGSVNNTQELSDARITTTSENGTDEHGNEVLANSKLHFRDVTLEDRDYYTCVATNSIHEAADDTLVRVKSHLLPLWPFLGILAEIIILAIIIGGYELYRRRHKAESDDKDAPLNQHAEDTRKKN